MCRVLNYTDHLISTTTGCISSSVSISVFASLVDIPITSSATGLNIYAITAEIKKYKSIIKKKIKKHDKIALFV